MATQCEIYIDQNNLDKALDSADAYQRAFPDQVLIHQYLEARMYLARGQAADAVTRLVAVVRGNPRLASARYYLALAHLKAGDAERARSVLEAFLREYPDDKNGLALREILHAGEMPQEEALDRAKALLEDKDA
jgi:predicted Zn-dependent protease